jgi:hypothetical protein
MAFPFGRAVNHTLRLDFDDRTLAVDLAPHAQFRRELL